MEYTEKIRTFIIDNFLFGDGSGVQDHSSLLDEGIIDSTGILELVAFLEKEFDIRIEDQEMIPENLDAIHSIAAFVQSKT